MEYVINVAQVQPNYPLGIHVFRVVCDGSEKAARRLFDLLRTKFPEEEGYIVDCSVWEKTGRQLDW